MGSTSINNEEKQRKQQQQHQELLLKLETEKNLANQSLIEIQKQWKKLLSNEKLESLQQEDVVKLRERCDAQLSEKNRTIKTLLGAFDNAEDQYRISFASHLQTMDGMIQMHDSMLCKMEREFHEKLETLRNDYEVEKKAMTDKFECDKDRILHETKSIDMEEKRLADEHIRNQQQAIEEIKNKNLEDENSLRFALDTRIEDLDEQFEIAKNEYLQKTDTQSEALQKQLEKEKEISKEMIALQCQIDKLCASIKRLKSISRRNSSQNLETNRRLLERKNKVISRYKDTKAKIENLRTFQHEKLKELTKEANRRKSDLEKEYSLIERIMKLIHLTKKMEIEQGRGEEEGEDEPKQQIKQKSSHVGKTSTFDTESIWERYNLALISMQKLKEEEDKQIKKNRVLKKKLQQYQDGVTVNDRVINDHNPLIVINGKMRPESRECLSKCSQSTPSVGLTVIDANHFSLTQNAHN